MKERKESLKYFTKNSVEHKILKKINNFKKLKNFVTVQISQKTSNFSKRLKL
jgi:predicted transport protein